ncbi:MAG: DNA polymerase IV [Defluviitaleaceae bacterium]|nr:DNA polymerase IV [Defluviitaleaceae bacterium]
MDRIIMHIDMDAFFAAVEIRDNPGLGGKPLIIGALPSERGVVATCSYEARVFGVRSAMSIKEAYRRCPHGVYMHPSMGKYAAASRQVHKIWGDYTDICEYISLDEGFLDITGTSHLFGGATAMAREIKRRTVDEVGLTCSVGVGYSMMSAKLASEEKKPDGFFVIPTAQDLKNLIIDRNVRVIYGVGAKTAEELQKIGITTVRHVLENSQAVVAILGNHGRQIIELAAGVDTRRVTAYSEAKSIGTEQTFQQDITDFDYLKDVLLLTAQRLSFDIKLKKLYANTITLKVTYFDMKSITRSKSGEATDKTAVIYETAAELLDKIERRPIRLIGITLNNLTETPNLQFTLFDEGRDLDDDKLSDAMMKLQLKYGRGIVKTASVLRAEKRLTESDEPAETPQDNSQA